MVSPDAYLLTESGEYVWSVPRVKAAWAQATAQTEKLIASGRFEKLVLLVGIPASGKSTWLKSHQEAGAIYFDATFTNAWKREPYIRMAKDAGMRVEAVYMNTPLLVCMDRNSCRTVDRKVPEDTLVNMAVSLAGDPPTSKEGFDAILKVNTPAARTAKNLKVMETPANYFPVKIEPGKPKFEGFIDFQGLKIDVENPKGSTRTKKGPDGEWSVFMHCHYGEIRGTEGVDGDKLDVYVGDNHDSPIVVVIHQHLPWDGSYDEDKVMLGYDSVEEAIGAYKKQYDRPGFYKDGEHTAMPIGQFWRWVQDGRKKGKKVTGVQRKRASATHLGALLALLRGVSWVHWTAHWVMEGEASYGDHELFDRLYQSTTGQIDALAEKLVATYGSDVVDPVSQAHQMVSALTSWSNESCAIKRSAWAERSLQVAIEDVLTQSGDLSVGMENFLEGLADEHETNLYLLGQRLKGRAASRKPSAKNIAVRFLLRQAASRLVRC